MNILDYIDWRGDITFAERGLNEVDNLIFAELAYLIMDGLVSEDGSVSPTLAELCEAYLAAGYDQSELLYDPLPLLKKASTSARFGGVRASRYVNLVDTEKQIQFSAVTYLYAEGEAYVAYRGTDNTIVGWREDMNFSFLSETPGQYESAAYLNRIAAEVGGRLTVGGHSKGGNFAVYGAAFCDPAARGHIVKVYSNDGPGFNKEIAESENYRAILDRTVKIIPDSSLVGILLSSKARRRVIKSDAKGVMQHVAYSWRVKGTSFEEADERTAASIFMDDTLHAWVDTLSEDELRALAAVIFDSLDAAGVTTVGDLNANRLATYSAVLKAVSQVDSLRKSEVATVLKKLIMSGRDVMLDEQKLLRSTGKNEE